MDNTTIWPLYKTTLSCQLAVFTFLVALIMYWWFWRWVGRLDWRYKNTTLGVLCLCWFPVLIWLLWEVATTSIPNSGFTYFAIMILSNSGMSFPIYLKTLPQFKEGFLSIIRIHGVQAPTAHSRRIRVLPAQHAVWQLVRGEECEWNVELALERRQTCRPLCR